MRRNQAEKKPPVCKNRRLFHTWRANITRMNGQSKSVLPVGAMLLRAAAIQREGVFVQLKAALLGNILLAAVDFGVEEPFPPAAVETHQMVVMGPFVELEHGFARLEVTA